MEKIETLSKRLEPIFQKQAVQFAYLFGSQVTGQINQESDFDLAVMLPEHLSAAERFDVRLKLMAEISGKMKTDKIDLSVLNDLQSILLKFVIIKQGRVIFNQDILKRQTFELKTMNDYYDYKPFLEAYNKAYAARQLNNNQ